MPNDRARYTAAEVARLAKTAARRRRGPIPRALPPLAIEKGYVEATTTLLAPSIAAFALRVFKALPDLVKSGDAAHAKAVVDHAYNEMASALHASSIEFLATRFAKRTMDFNAQQLGKQIRAALGVDLVMQDRARPKLTRNFIALNVTYVQDVAEELAAQVSKLLVAKVQRFDDGEQQLYTEKAPDGWYVKSSYGYSLDGPLEDRGHADMKLRVLMAWVARSEPRMDAAIDNVGIIGNLPEGADRTALAQAIEDAYAAGDTTRTLAKVIEERFGVAASRAERIARDQIGTLNSQVNQARQRELGVTKYKWRTMNDEAVRDSHSILEDEEFSYDDPPIVDGEAANPGEPILCRCYPEPVFTEILDLGFDLND